MDTTTIRITSGGIDICTERAIPPAIAVIDTIDETPIKIAADGSRLPSAYAGTDHVAVLFPQRRLMFAVESLGNPDNPDDGIAQEQCAERCKQLRLLGYDDWRLPTRAELARLIDDTRREPAIDTSIFPKVKPRWYWTSTQAAWSSASAWFVSFGYGYVNHGHRGYYGFALAVRRAGQ
jgi:hypothetical protein